MEQQEIRQKVMQQVQGALMLDVAYAGVVNGLFTKLKELGAANSAELAAASHRDPGYVERWCDSAFAFELLDRTGNERFELTELGAAFRPEAPETLMPFAIQTVLSAHMAERAAGLMPSGERPGEQVLAERETILPWFGPMLEHQFGPLLEGEILNGVPAFAKVARKGGVSVDLGCGNGWYLRRLVSQFPHIRGIGLDGFEQIIRQAAELAEKAGCADRLDFRSGDLHRFNIDEPVDLIAMNRALHHVWSEKENVFRILSEHLRPGGVAVIWEPNWPADTAELRKPPLRPMAFQNLAEHIQGNHFLRPEEISEEFRKAGMAPEVFLFAGGREQVVVGTKPE